MLRRRAAAWILLLGALTGCGGGDGEAPAAAAGSDAVRIEITPARLSLAPGAVAPLDVKVFAADGSALTTPVTLQSSDPALAVVEDQTVRAVANGSVRITASVGAGVGASIQVRIANPISSQQAIEAAQSAGSIDASTALAYRVYALFGDPRLPIELLGNQPGRSDRRTLGELTAALPTLPPALQADLAPYLLPPIYRDSWLGNRRAAEAAARHLAGPNAAAQTAAGVKRRALANEPRPPLCSGNVDAGWESVDHDHVRVWYDKAHSPRHQAVAQNVLDALVFSWARMIDANGARPPLEDVAAWPCHGGDGRLDVYLVGQADMPGMLGITTGLLPWGVATPVHLLLNADRLSGDLAALRATATHELLHAVAHAHRYGPTWSYFTLSDGLADWMSTYVWNGVDPGVMAFQNRSVGDMFTAADAPLFSDVDDKRYGTQLLFRLVERTAGAAKVFAFLKQMETQDDALLAMDATFPGLEATWHDFVLRLWNAPPTDAAGAFAAWDSLKTQPTLARDIELTPGPTGTQVCTAPRKATASAGDCESASAAVNVNELSARYERFSFSDPTIKSFTFHNGYTFALDCSNTPCVSHSAADSAVSGRRLYALVKAAGAWALQDWTDVRKLCLNPATQHIEQIVLIHSNGSFSTVRPWRNAADIELNAAEPIGPSPSTMVVSERGCQWDAAAEFSAKTNPAGVWSYGWYPQDRVGAVALNLFAIQGNFSGIDSWRRTFDQDLGAPIVVHNSTDTFISTVTGLPWNQAPQVTIPYFPDALAFHPGPESVAVVRWTAPFAGSVTVTGIFETIDPAWTGVTTLLLHNGRPIDSADISRASPVGSFLQRSALGVQAGDTLEFVVGNRGDFHFDSIMLTARVSMDE